MTLWLSFNIQYSVDDELWSATSTSTHCEVRKINTKHTGVDEVILIGPKINIKPFALQAKYRYTKICFLHRKHRVASTKKS